MCSVKSLTAGLTILLASSLCLGQEMSASFQFWQEVAEVDREFSRAATELGRTEAYLEVLGEGSVLFRNGPVDARELYQREQETYRLDQLYWRDHFIDVSRAGDLGIVVGPNLFTPSQPGPNGEDGQQSSSFLANAWHKIEGRWTLMADMAVTLPGFLSMDVEADFQDTVAVMAETAHQGMAIDNTMGGLAEADNRLGININFRGGQRSIERFALQNVRVYLPSMGAAVGMEAAGAAYGRYLDSRVTTASPIELTHMGGYLAESKELGYTYGTMTSANQGDSSSFRVNYLRVWRFSPIGEWKLAVELLRPY
jgi:hypothetical protein